MPSSTPDTAMPPASTRHDVDIPMTARCVPAQLARGFAMGSADVVPGVSGGTVALVLGIYRQLIAALERCVDVMTAAFRFDWAEVGAGLKRVPWFWIIGLLGGILVAVFTLAGPLEHALATYPEPMAGLFTGLIAAACVLCWKQIGHTTPLALVLLAVWAVGFFVLLGVSPAGETAGGPQPALWVFFVTGAIAICAMILPGVSGSFLLVLMGVYAHVLAAVSNRDVLVLLVFVLGCATGISLASKGLSWLLEHHHDAVVASMIGLMVGSIRILWPWPGGLESTELGLPTADTWLVPTVLAVIGFVVVIGIDALASRRGTTQNVETV